jgi:hypothetical protein
MNVQFIASVAAITSNPEVSRRLYVDALSFTVLGSSPGGKPLRGCSRPKN